MGRPWVRGTSADIYTLGTREWQLITLCFFFPTALSDHHSAEEKTMILDEFFYRLEKQFLLSPEDYMGVMCITFMIIEKSRP